MIGRLFLNLKQSKKTAETDSFSREIITKMVQINPQNTNNCPVRQRLDSTKYSSISMSSGLMRRSLDRASLMILMALHVQKGHMNAFNRVSTGTGTPCCRSLLWTLGGIIGMLCVLYFFLVFETLLL